MDYGKTGLLRRSANAATLALSNTHRCSPFASGLPYRTHQAHRTRNHVHTFPCLTRSSSALRVDTARHLGEGNSSAQQIHKVSILPVDSIYRTCVSDVSQYEPTDAAHPDQPHTQRRPC